MGKLSSLGHRLLINNKENSIRSGFIFFLSNILLLISLIFAVEIILILLGIGDIILPWTRKALDVLNKLVF